MGGVVETELAAEAVAASRRAAGDWAGTPAAERGEILRQAAGLLDERAEEVGRDLARAEGKTLAEAVHETQLAARVLRYYAAQALDPDGETYPSQQPGVLLYCLRGPIGVVSAITP
jgi:acyl-CoA reductase-like NAD-dependent aldehyde dehydrogenase